MPWSNGMAGTIEHDCVLTASIRFSLNEIADPSADVDQFPGSNAGRRVPPIPPATGNAPRRLRCHVRLVRLRRIESGVDRIVDALEPTLDDKCVCKYLVGANPMMRFMARP
jgi:hypothetical protein